MIDQFLKGAEIIMHLGAHRTGTTHIQQQLDLAAPLLARTGTLVLTPPRAGKRGGITIREFFSAYRRLHRRRFASLQRDALKLQLESFLQKQVENVERVVISDEMFLGTTFSPGRVGIYPECATSLDAARSFLGPNVSHIHLAVRDYASFIVSAYAMRALYSRNISPFDAHYAELMRLPMRWPDIALAIRHAFSGATLHVWRFPYNLAEGAMKHALLGERINGECATPLDSLNPAPTLEAITYALANKHKPGYDADEILERFRTGHKFMPLTDREVRDLDKIYQTDLSRLRKLGVGHVVLRDFE